MLTVENSWEQSKYVILSIVNLSAIPWEEHDIWYIKPCEDVLFTV